jgi:uncharacterized membrane protein YgcG
MKLMKRKKVVRKLVLVLASWEGWSSIFLLVPTLTTTLSIVKKRERKKEVFHPPIMMPHHHPNVNGCAKAGKFYFGRSVSTEVVSSNGRSEEGTRGGSGSGSGSEEGNGRDGEGGSFNRSLKTRSNQVGMRTEVGE